ncbi:hypothetical protein [Rhizobium wuzhouense]|uniref:Uncharacterized protein n=1 Tax=Rhizobium wuzhouense TaxID=1986026 RepID=A0ABX5NN57_9HYPH|nr:hypothetical protein [Rhizobium wuzhouense]PYB71259.1 hypothetical protein DMY87_18005 [Rhizobium wuzhouense]
MSGNSIDKGYACRLRFTVVDDLGAKAALDGAEIAWALAASKAGPPLITRDSGGMTISTSAATVDFSLTRAETGALQPGRYYHQLSIGFAGREPEVYFSGFLIVEARL